MKKQIILVSSFLLISVLTFAQARLTVNVSNDSILLGNTFKVSFSLENAEGNNFSAPDLSLYFDVVSGPNTSTSISMMNGAMSRSITYSYYLKPRSEGIFYIEPASIETPDGLLETTPLEVIVVPNPDGTIQSPSNDPFGMMPFNQQPDPNGVDPFGDLKKMQDQIFKMFEGQGDLFNLSPDLFNFGEQDTTMFKMMPPGMDFFQMNPDSLWKQLPEELKKMMPEHMQPADPKKKKKRKIYKI